MTKIIDAMRAAGATDEVEPIVNPDFETLLDVQTAISYDELKKMILAEGIRDPIVVWKEQNTILDGHNRKKIATELNIPCPRTDMSFKDETEAKAWIIRNQLGRRNLTPARFEYYVGALYNETKIETTDAKLAAPGETAKKIGKEFDLSPQTVRRYATKAKGTDYLEKVKGKLAKQKQLSSKPEYTTDEINAIASASNTTVAAKTMTKIDSYKTEAKVKKEQAKKEQHKIIAKATLYNVVLCKPEFGVSGFSVTTEPKPTMDKEAIVYMIVPDENLEDGMKLLERWNLTYEASIIYYSSKTYDAIFTKVAHQFVLLGSKGQIMGPAAGKQAVSCNLLNGDISPALLKLIETYHPNGGAKKLDMRRSVKPLAGWDSVTK